MARDRNSRHVGSCPDQDCGKLRYLSRKDARAAARLVDPGDRMSPYPCGSYWHFGHLKAAVLRGDATRDGQTNKPAVRPSPVGAAQMRAMWEGTTGQPAATA
jgi:hypothetical protein